jgi:hypothetical protein
MKKRAAHELEKERPASGNTLSGAFVFVTARNEKLFMNDFRL